MVRRAPYNKVCFFNYFPKSAKTHHFLNQPADVVALFLRYYPISIHTKKKSYKKNILILNFKPGRTKSISLIRARFNSNFCKHSYKPNLLLSQICPLGLAALCVKKMGLHLRPTDHRLVGQCAKNAYFLKFQSSKVCL